MQPKPTDALTSGEKEALRLYLRTSDPKQIAAELDRSHHEIERRFKEARRKLGVNRTRDAAALLAMEEGNPAYQSAIYRDLVGSEDRHFDLIRPPSEGGWTDRNLPLPTKGRPWNALPLDRRVIAILAGMLILVMTAVLLVNLAQTLSSIVRPHR